MKPTLVAVAMVLAISGSMHMRPSDAGPERMLPSEELLINGIIDDQLEIETNKLRPEEAIAMAIVNYPDPIVRYALKPLADLFREHMVKLQASDFVASMETSLDTDQGNKKIFLWYNPEWVNAASRSGIAEDKRDLTMLKLYHQVIHIEDHLDGKIPLRPLVPTNPIEIDYADKVWDAEWSAVKAEWTLAKSIGKADLMTEIWTFTRSKESDTTFLRGFAELQKRNVLAKKYDSVKDGLEARKLREIDKLVFRFHGE